MLSKKKEQSSQRLMVWRVKLQLAAEGSYQAIQQIKEHVLEDTYVDHPIFKESFYDILQQGYNLHEILCGDKFMKEFENYKQFPLFFLLCGTYFVDKGSIKIVCINLEGDTETVSIVKDRGLVTVEESFLGNKYGQNNVNLLTRFEIIAEEDSIMIEIQGRNRLHQIMNRVEIGEKQGNIMRKFMIFPSKEIVKMTIGLTNRDHVKDRIYLLEGRACYYLDDERLFGKRIILCCFQQGYLNPKQFQYREIDGNFGIPSSFNLFNGKGLQRKYGDIKLHVFDGSVVMYLEQNFLKDDLIKALELKRQEHIMQILKLYQNLQNQEERVQTIQNQLITKYKLNKKEVNTNILKILSPKKQKTISTTKDSLLDKRVKSRNDLISTSSSMKCSIRVRKSKKLT